MGHECYLKVSDRTGNPELWAFEEGSFACDLVFCSMVTGGINRKSKVKGYGRGKQADKARSYSYAGTFEFGDIPYARTLVQCAYNNIPPSSTLAPSGGFNGQQYRLAEEALRIAKRPVPVWWRAGVRAPTTPPPPAQPEPTEPKQRRCRVKLAFVKNHDEDAASYSW